MTATAHTTPAINNKLRGLRRSVRTWYFVHGLSRVMWWMVVLISADLLLDYNTRMDLPQRVICLGVFIIVLAVVAFRQLLRPLLQAMNDDTLVARVEEQHEGLGDSVISAVQFARADHAAHHAQGVSQAMIDATIDQGIVAASRVNFRDVLDRSTFQKNLLFLVLFAVLIGLGAYAVAETAMMRTWFDRNVILGDTQWPQDTYLTIDGVIDDKLTLPRGDDWEQAVKAKGVVPSVVYLEYRPEGGRTLTQQMTQRGERQFVSMFKNMLEPFRFRVYGGDSITPWTRVELVDRPSLDSFELKLSPPKYTGIEPQVVWSIGTKTAGDDTKLKGTSAVYALKGSSLTITGKSNKKLSKARMRLGSEKKNVPLSDSGDSFVINITPKELAAGSYSIDLTDATGLDSKRPTRFTVRVKQDRDPTARVKLNGIGSMIVPWARVPVVATLTDDYAITSAKLKFQWRGESEESPKGEGEKAFDQLKAGEKRVEYLYPFDVKPLEVPISSFLTFHVEATDNDTISGPKTGESTTFFVKVVSEQDLRSELLRREQEQRQEFERLIRNQDVLLADTQSVLAEVRGKSKLTKEHEAMLIKAHKQQRLMSMRCKAIAEHFEQIKAEVDNNRLEEEGGPIQRRVQSKIINPLRNLASELIPNAADFLDKGRKSPNDTAARDHALTDAERAQQRVVAEMRLVLKHMVKWEGYQEAVNLALEVFSAQEKVNSATRLEIQRRVQGIFGDDDKKD